MVFLLNIFRGSKMKNPKVSVIIPCYNAEKHLIQCLDSVANQTLKDIEIICVDDGSTDSTPVILQQYAQKDPRFVVLNQENKNAGNARNNGLKIARGEYLSFLDADDFFELEMLEQMAKSADLYHADFTVCHSDQYLIDKQKLSPAPWVVQDMHIPRNMPFSHHQLTDNVFRVFVGWAWDKLYRRSFVEEHGLRFQEQRTTNDMLFVFSALVLAERITVVDGVYAHQRCGAKDSLSVTREKSWHCFYDALIALRQRLMDEGLYRELEKDYINYALHFSLWNLNTLAEPTHSILEAKLRDEWLSELGIADKTSSFFCCAEEYVQFRWLSSETASKIMRHLPWPVKQAVIKILCRIFVVYFKIKNCNCA